MTLAACVGLAASPALAQGQGRGGDRGGERGRQPGEGAARRNGMMGGMMGGMGRFGGMNEPVMTSRDLPRYGEILQMNADQQEAAQALLEAYQLEVQARRDEMQKAQEEMREAFRRQREDGGEGGMPNFDRMREAQQSFRTAKSKLDKTFMGDLRSLLTPEQETRWTAFERVHRRETQIDRGLISGERIDLIKLVEEAKLPAEAAAEVGPILAQYEEELDRELANREKVQEDLMTRMGEIRMGPDVDLGRMQMMIDEGRTASKRVRDVNRKYARQIQALLPEEQQFAFAKAVKTAGNPDIYRESYAGRAITSAGGFADVDAAQKDSIEALRSSYTRDAAVINDKIAAAQEEMEENFNLERMAQGGDRGQEALRELRRQKRELDEATVESLKKILTPEQAERLPEQPRLRGFPDGVEGGGRRRGGDGNNEGGDRPRRGGGEGGGNRL